MKTIFQAAHEDDLDALSQLLSADGNLANSVDPNSGWAPLHFAAEQNRSKAASFLIENGADRNARTPQGITALLMAGGDSVLQTLRRLGADFSENYQFLRTAKQTDRLVQLTYKEHVRTVKVIQLGLTEAQERCFAWQHTGTPDHPEPGLRCFKVHGMSELSWAEPHPVKVVIDRSRVRACVTLVDPDLEPES